jgi:hypothetical protein
VHRHEVGSPQPQGSSLLPELCCLEPSSLNRPHPPHSWAHRIFTAWRLIRDAFAVRERRGDPRVVPGFRYPFCPGIPSSPTPGSSIIVSSSAAMSTRPSPRVDRLGTPKTPAIRFTRAMTFVASWFTHLLRSASLLAPCTDLTGYPASGAFTSRLPAGWSPFPLQDITTTATGLLCWRDSHPLEWQLASLHLLLHRDGLAPSTPCRSPGALRFAPMNGHRRLGRSCQFRATSGLMYRSKMFVLRGAFNAAVDFAAQRRSAAAPPIARKGSLAKSFELLKEASGNAA